MVKTFAELAESEEMKHNFLELLEEKDCDTIAAIYIDIGISCIDIGIGLTDGKVGLFKKLVREIQNKAIKKKEKEVSDDTTADSPQGACSQTQLSQTSPGYFFTPVSEPRRSFNSGRGEDAESRFSLNLRTMTVQTVIPK